MSEQLKDVAAEYAASKAHLDALVTEAAAWAERFERLAHGLSARPDRLIIGDPEQQIENPGEWDVLPEHPLPTIEHLIGLTSGIRAAAARVEALREQLILMGHAELVEQPNEYFE